MSSEEYNKTLPSKEKYNKTLLSKVDDLKQGLQYYIDRINQLEQELKYYEKAYNNRTEEYLKLEKRITRLDFISKDKIREKIKEYKGLKEIDKMAYEEQIKPLQELLEEE